MALSIESGKIFGQIVSVLKYIAKISNETRRFRPSPKNIKALLMSSPGADQNQTLFKSFRDPVKALPLPVLPKETFTKKKEEVEFPMAGFPEIYGEKVPMEDLFASWINYAQDKTHLPNENSELKPRVVPVGIARPYYPVSNTGSRLEEIKKRIRDRVKKNASPDPTKSE